MKKLLSALVLAGTVATAPAAPCGRAYRRLRRRQHDLCLVPLHREVLDGGGPWCFEGSCLIRSQDRDRDL